MKKKILLINAKPGERVKVITFDEAHVRPRERYAGYIRRLEEMGILPRQVITVTRNGRIGPVEVMVKGSQLVIGRGIASKIIVEIINE
jgi:ferrous iron transport protein A